ncbi:flagellar biosynthetic protein FliO [Solidesulfovibrio fructosivorans JJ]]|uniref:Flagellar protein n=2 Tax=Solidesulfovibrio fructosivorans TaxID=878 RepID=E1JVA0_SOLFR|nr:flagellar biosynthetic protein FliO [Solidesulfovibrio fructosivorans JJ]]
MPPASDYGLAGAALHMGLALLVILALIFAAYWVLRRFGPKLGLGPAGRGGMLRIMSHLSLGPRKSIIVVRFLNGKSEPKDLVLGVTDHSITLLTEDDAPHDTAAATDFAAALADKTSRPGGDAAS